jgi:hypothetical protein
MKLSVMRLLVTHSWSEFSFSIVFNLTQLSQDVTLFRKVSFDVPLMIKSNFQLYDLFESFHPFYWFVILQNNNFTVYKILVSDIR